MLFGALMLALIVVGTASLLRTGRTLLDRLMVAIVLVAAMGVVGGYVFTFWPWGLNRYAVAVTALLVLLGAALVTGRRPRLPRAFLGSDLILLGGTAFAALIVAWPTLHSTSLGQSLSYSAITGDRMRHFNLFDGIRRIGGYPFLHYEAAAPIVQDDIAKVYPQSAHFLYALIDSFLTGPGGLTDPVAEYGRYYAYVIGGYAFLALAAAWAVRWVAGPGLSGWRTCLTTSLVGCMVATGVLTTLIWCSFDPQVLSMAFVVIAAALLARGPARPVEHLLLALSACVVAISAYPMYAMFLAPVGLCAIVVYRRRLLRRWVASTVLILVAAVAAALPSVLASSDGLEAGDHLLLLGYVIRPGWLAFGMFVLLSVAGLWMTRSPMRRVYGLGLAGSGLALAVLGVYQYATIGVLAYYFDKAAQAYLVLLFVGAGLALRWIRWRPVADFRATLLACVGAVLVSVFLTGAISVGPIRFDRDIPAVSGNTTWGRVWASGEVFHGPQGPPLGYLAERGYIDEVATVAITSREPGTNANVSVGLAVFQHDLGLLRQQVYATGYAPVDLVPLEKAILASTVPLRLVTNDPVVNEHFSAYAANNPGLKFTVVYDPAIPAT